MWCAFFKQSIFSLSPISLGAEYIHVESWEKRKTGGNWCCPLWTSFFESLTLATTGIFRWPLFAFFSVSLLKGRRPILIFSFQDCPEDAVLFLGLPFPFISSLLVSNRAWKANPGTGIWRATVASWSKCCHLLHRNLPTNSPLLGTRCHVGRIGAELNVAVWIRVLPFFLTPV